MNFPIRLRKSISKRKANLLLLVLSLAAIFANVIRIVPEAQSYGFLFIVLCGALVSYFCILIFTEFAMVFVTDSGGIFSYISDTYSRYIGFIAAITIFFFGYLYIISDFLLHLKIFFGFNAALLIVMSLIIVVTLIQYFSIDLLYLIISCVFIIPLLFFIIIILLINFESSYPLLGPLNFSIGEAILKSIFPFVLTIIPFSVFIAEMQDVEEELLAITKRTGYLFLIFIPLLFFLIMGAIDVATINYVPVYASLFDNNMFIFISIITEIITHLVITMVWLFALPRMIFSMAIKGLLPSYFARHSGRGLPVPTLLFQMVLAVMLIVITIYFLPNSFWGATKAGIFIIFFLFVMSLFWSRIRRPEYERPFTIKKWKSLSILASLFILIGLVAYVLEYPEYFMIYFMLVVMLLPFYFILEKWYSEEFNSLSDEFFITFQRILLFLFFPLYIRRKVIKNLGLLEGKKVLDYGARYGALTKYLMQGIGTAGVLYSTDISDKLMKRLQKKINTEKHYALFYSNLPSSASLSIPPVDVIVSAFAISRCNKLDQLLKQLNNSLKRNGVIEIIDFDKIFHIIPNKWLGKDKIIQEFFDRNGFGVAIERFKGIFGSYVLIKGIKFKDAYYLDTWYSGKDI